MIKKLNRIVGKRLNKKEFDLECYGCFSKIYDPINGRGIQFLDYLMSGLAVFSLKYPSLLELTQ
ncbi:MAG: hypothetical protein OXF08_11755 [Bacteroidetes bacterium]|nr:hypothetical protein [Bacteroidota bacterium]